MLRDQRGTTMTELLVGLTVGTTVMVGLTTLVVITFQNTARVSARVDGTQRARLAMNRIVDQMHSACLAPKAPPIREGSSGTEMRFIHARGSSSAPTPTLTKITYANNELTQYDYAWQSGLSPTTWVFGTTPSKVIPLVDQITPASSTKPIFSYYSSSSGSTGQLTPLTAFEASRTIHVTIVFKTAPRHGSGDDAVPARIQGGGTFRLTAASYRTEVPSLPCQ